MDFSAAELSGFRTAQDGHMMDTGNLQPVSTSKDTFGQLVETWPTNSADIDCGLEMRPGSERHTADGDFVVVTYDATVRLPIATTYGMRDRFRVTKRFGETLSTALVFEFVGPAQRGPSGIRARLKRIET